MKGSIFINNEWVFGEVGHFVSQNPATGETIWEGNAASEKQIDIAVQAARSAFPEWSSYTLEKRLGFLEDFTQCLSENKKELAQTISDETGKPLWEALTEVGAMIGKLAISVEAYHERCPEKQQETSVGLSVVRHKPHGVLAVLGPFNFPGHLPNGHIIPALLAGNTIVFKASELTPLVAEKMVDYWEYVGLPKGVLNLVQGDVQVAEPLSKHPDLNGVLFTGSFRTGQLLTEAFSKTPEKLLALEMGGNNPLVVHDVKNIEAAVYHALQSGYITAGQRCTCARRLIVTKGTQGEQFVEQLGEAIQKLKVGFPSLRPEPFMGTVISNSAADRIVSGYETLVAKGGKPLVALKRLDEERPLLSPGLVDVSNISDRVDEEIFGPLMQLIWVEHFEDALEEANKTAYGLSAGLFCDDQSLYHQFLLNSRAGIVNWNRPLTGASSKAPFGGVGHSGNYRPSAYYAADYSAYPVASLEEQVLTLPDTLLPGVQL